MNPTYIGQIGKRISDRRIEKEYRLLDVADAAHVSVEFIRKLENGSVNPKLETLALIGQFLDLSLYDLAGNPDL